jgi:hypothetical protein
VLFLFIKSRFHKNNSILSIDYLEALLFNMHDLKNHNNNNNSKRNKRDPRTLSLINKRKKKKGNFFRMTYAYYFIYIGSQGDVRKVNQCWGTIGGKSIHPSNKISIYIDESEIIKSHEENEKAKN